VFLEFNVTNAIRFDCGSFPVSLSGANNPRAFAVLIGLRSIWAAGARVLRELKLEQVMTSHESFLMCLLVHFIG